MNDDKDIKKFLRIINNNALDIYNAFKEKEPKFKEIQKRFNLVED